MIPQRFEQANAQLGAPKGWTDEQCASIHVFRGIYENGDPCTISAWRPTPEELVKLNAGEFIYLMVSLKDANGTPTMPPVSLQVGDPWMAPSAPSDDA